MPCVELGMKFDEERGEELVILLPNAVAKDSTPLELCSPILELSVALIFL